MKIAQRRQRLRHVGGSNLTRDLVTRAQRRSTPLNLWQSHQHSMGASRGFVRVSHDRARFEEGPPGVSRPVFFAGANCYYLLVSEQPAGCEQRGE